MVEKEETGEGLLTSSGQCFDDHWWLGSLLSTNTHPHRQSTHLGLSSDVIRMRVISSASLLIPNRDCPRLMGAP